MFPIYFRFLLSPLVTIWPLVALPFSYLTSPLLCVALSWAASPLATDLVACNGESGNDVCVPDSMSERWLLFNLPRNCSTFPTTKNFFDKRAQNDRKSLPWCEDKIKWIQSLPMLMIQRGISKLPACKLWTEQARRVRCGIDQSVRQEIRDRKTPNLITLAARI